MKSNEIVINLILLGSIWLNPMFKQLSFLLSDRRTLNSTRFDLRRRFSGWASVLQHILASRPSIGGRSITMSPPLCQLTRTHVRRAPPRLPVGNPDINLLHPENLKPTHVTLRIAALATDLFHEQLIVLGQQLPAPHSRRGTHLSISKRERDALVRALGMALSAVGEQKIETPVSWRVHPRGPFMCHVALCDVRGLLPRVVFKCHFLRHPSLHCQTRDLQIISGTSSLLYSVLYV